MGGEGKAFILKPIDMKKGAEAPLFIADFYCLRATLRQGGRNPS